LLFAALMVCLSLLGGLSAYTPQGPEAPGGYCYISINGVVKWPGVYAFSSPTSLDQLIKRAGGLEGTPALEHHTLEKILYCSDSVTVKAKDGHEITVKRGKMNAFYRVTLGMKLDLNQETAEALTAIPGIGPKLAYAIVAQRQKSSGFQGIEDLLAVPGIGPKLFQRICKYVTLTPLAQHRGSAL